jgi:hypothetical protein
VTSSSIKIAVCGHRRLDDPHRLETSILISVQRIHAAYPGHPYQVYSCLAQGADRLLAGKFIQALPADLTVILPLPEQEYLKDFKSEQSIQEYNKLKYLAKAVITPDLVYTRPQAYREANRRLMENCDLLVTVWDGLPARGPGGTAELVKMARLSERPLLWIHANDAYHTGRLIVERLNTITQ